MSQELKDRSKKFALETIALVSSLGHGADEQVLGKQLLRAATAVGANYRAACRARSRADFVSKITIGEEEADECIYWLELLRESGRLNSCACTELLQEAHELTAIFTASGKTAKRKRWG